MKTLCKLLLIIVPILICLNTCKKDLPSCNGNCSTFNISGIVYDKTTNQPLINQLVKVDAQPISYSLISLENMIGSVKTDNSGHFNINISFDTSWFKNYYLLITPTVPNNYLEYVDNGQSSSSNVYAVRLYSFDSSNYNNIKFGFYPKALLKINLHRTTIVISQEPELFLNFSFQGQTSINSVIGINQSDSNKDTTISVNTTANYFTKIVTQKFITATNVITITDSIKCLANSKNSIDINY